MAGAIHLLCLSANGERLSKPGLGGAQAVHHGLHEFLALAQLHGATPLLLASNRFNDTTEPTGEAHAMIGQDTFLCGVRSWGDIRGLTNELCEVGPLLVRGLSVEQGHAIGRRLVGVDLCRVLCIATTIDELASVGSGTSWDVAKCTAQSTVHNANERAGYHLLFYAWGRDFATKSKRKILDTLDSADLPKRLGCLGARHVGPRASVYHSVTADQVQGEVVHLSLLQVHNPARRDKHGMKGALEYCTLVQECASPALMRRLRFLCVKNLPAAGLTPIRPELGTVMANLGHVGPGSIVLDPFCGAGSLLLAATAVGAIAIGSDAAIPDCAKCCGIGQGVAANFDAANFDRPQLVQNNIFWPSFRGPIDAILADPPYGTREIAIGNSSGESKSVSNAETNAGVQNMCYIQDSSGAEILEQVRAMVAPLLMLAARCLVPDGRLVLLFPTFHTQTELGLWDATVSGGGAVCGPVAAEEGRLLVGAGAPLPDGLIFESCTHEPCVSRSMARNVVVLRRQASKSSEMNQAAF